MATTSLWRIKGSINTVIKYVENPEKTETAKLNIEALEDLIAYAGREEATQKQKFVSGINCNPETARSEMLAVKDHFGKPGGTIAYHGYQSFAEGEVTPQQAHSIGIALANELWGDRYQVLVATHLDKASHLHNHFVINTVSFVDGIKFHRTKHDYAMMQEVSDRLCKEAGLSVVREKQGLGRSYGEWWAENEGRPTIRGGIRKDIDEAVARSVTAGQFMNIMKDMGYEFKLYTESGNLLKYPGLRPPGAKGFFRFHKLGPGYSLDEIGDRILSNTRPKLPFEELQKPLRKVHSARPKKKLHGIYALYIRYCYELHIIVKQPRRKRLHFELREDATKLSRLDAQTRFMARNGLMTAGDIAAYKSSAESLMSSLSEERRILRNSLKSFKRRGDESGIEAVRKDIAARSEQIKDIRREIKLCEEILERAEGIKLRLEYAMEYRSEKENEHDEYIRRRGRTGREDEPGSR